MILYTFRYRDLLTGKWVQARYKAELHEIRERHGDAARAGVGKLLQIQGHVARVPEEGLDGAGPRLPER